MNIISLNLYLHKFRTTLSLFSVVTKPRHLAPYIDRKNLAKRVIRVGEMLSIEADVKGEPAPKSTWTLKDSPIKNDRLKTESQEYKTTFVLIKAQRSDTGIYTVTAVNDSGKDVVDLDLTVLGKPSPPKGPLKVCFSVYQGFLCRSLYFFFDSRLQM